MQLKSTYTHTLGWLVLTLCACPPPDGGEPATSTTTTSSSATSASCHSSSGETSSTTGDTSSTTSDSTSSTSADSSTTAGESSTSTSTSGDSTTSTSGDSTTGDSTTTGGAPPCEQNFAWDDLRTCYTAPIVYDPVPGAGLLLAGDVDQDGHADLIVPGATGGIAVLRGDGSGALATPVLTPVDPPTGAAAGDFDGDGKLDLVVSFAGPVPRIDLLLGDGLGGFVLEDSFPSGPTVGTHLAAADFDNDGDLDAVAIHQGVSNTVHKRLSSITSNAGTSWTYSDQPLTMFVADVLYSAWVPWLGIGSVDGVHTDVIVATDRSVESPRQLRSDGLGGFTYLGPLHPGNGLVGGGPVVFVDFEGDGDNDVVSADRYGTLQMRSAVNLGGGAWSPVVLSPLFETGKRQMALGDLIHDTRPDVVYTATDGQTMARTIEVDGTIVSPGPPGFQLGYARGFVLTDLNEDGLSDFVFISIPAGDALSVRLSE
ncbi:FG-GAP repeat domain-containing protein [Nannocystis pusilla]|uniref:VCBS repeat-containing protein n=1 Tax=Nannocystis pusilla TaxID=889268 RepID=A0ABS7TPF7_9BACT|nr:VCBS repeat-containing protein [Nannocystis pusilla]MBZ5710113.1 VCBS repeat-containing protein [Nannocystis pusilla]